MSTANLDSADLGAVAYGGLINEDVMQSIFNISPVDLPFMDMIGTETSSNSYKEWTQDSLAAVNTSNAIVDGADAGANNAKTGKRVGNQHQISEKVVKVSDRARNVDTIGRADELVYQLMNRQKELKRDMEAILTGVQASVADNGDATAGKVGALGAWFETNTSRGAGGADGGFSSGTVAAPTNGTIRALSEATIKDMMELAYNEGGDPRYLMSTPKVIRKLSEYLFTSSARVATLMSNVSQGSRDGVTAQASVNVIVTDFGTLEFVPNRLQQLYNTGTAANVFLIDPTYWAVSYLQGIETKELARTGSAENRHMTVDYTLVAKQEAASAVIADIDPTAAVTA